MTLLLNKLQALPKQYSLITDAWCRDCHRVEYRSWCEQAGVEPVDEQLFDVYYEALRDEYFAETSKPAPTSADELLRKHGICGECGELFEHHIYEPFASCKCGTSEWYELTPHMELQKQLNDAKREAKLSQLSPTYRMLLNTMLADGIIEYEVIDRMSFEELRAEIHEYALK